MLEREDAFYTANKTEFHEKYADKWLIIVEESLYGVYDTVAEASKTALKHFKPGKFMMRRPADDNLVIEVGPIIRTKHPDDNRNSKSCPDIIYSAGSCLKVSHA